MSYTTPTIRASGATWTQLKTFGLVGLLESLLTVNMAPTAAPGVATVAPIGGGATGGLLAAGVYYASVTEVNGVGETTAVETASFTVASTNIPRVTFASLKTGNSARNLYLTAVGGASGTEVLYASGIAAATYDLAVAAPASTTVPPTSNSTAVTSNQASMVRLVEANVVAYQLFLGARHAVGSYLRGDPVSTAEVAQKMLDYAVVYALLARVTDEAATLIAANPGTISTVLAGSAPSYQFRTLP